MEIHNIWILVSRGGGFFCARSNSAANLGPMEMDSFADAIRRKAIALTSVVRSVAWAESLKREKSFLKPVDGTVGRCCVAAKYVAFIWMGWSIAFFSCIERLGDVRLRFAGFRTTGESGAAWR